MLLRPVARESRGGARITTLDRPTLTRIRELRARQPCELRINECELRAEWFGSFQVRPHSYGCVIHESYRVS